jgi:hypothetical protein
MPAMAYIIQQRPINAKKDIIISPLDLGKLYTYVYKCVKLYVNKSE